MIVHTKSCTRMRYQENKALCAHAYTLLFHLHLVPIDHFPSTLSIQPWRLTYL